MNEVVSDLVKTGVEMGTAALVLFGIVSLLNTTSEINSALSERTVNQLRVQEYRAYNQYDDKVVYATDIVSAIYEHRGEPYVHVIDSVAGKEYLWSSSNIPKYPTAIRYNTYKAATITALIDQSKLYKAKLEYSENGGLLGITFTAQ